MLPLILRRLYFSVLTVLDNVSITQIIIFLIQLTLVFYLSVVVPFPLRYALVADGLPQVVPLEFTFHTCYADLHGVCSFPEAQALVEPGALSLRAGQTYDMTLELWLYDTPQNRQLGVFIVDLEPRTDDGRPLAVLQKSVLIPRSTFGYDGDGHAGGAGVLSAVYTLTRNIVFLPLYLVGYFAPADGLPASDTRRVDVAFSRPFVESRDSKNATQVVHVQLQSKFIQALGYVIGFGVISSSFVLQLATASLCVEARVSVLRRFVAERPLAAHLAISAALLAVLSSTFIVYWLWRSYELYEALRR